MFYSPHPIVSEKTSALVGAHVSDCLFSLGVHVGAWVIPLIKKICLLIIILDPLYFRLLANNINEAKFIAAKNFKRKTLSLRSYILCVTLRTGAVYPEPCMHAQRIKVYLCCPKCTCMSSLGKLKKCVH